MSRTEKFTGNLFGDSVTHPADTKPQRKSVAAGAWESFRRVPKDLEEGSRDGPNKAGKYPYQVFHESLGKMPKAQRDRFFELLIDLPANDLDEFILALNRWRKLDDWERQNYAQAVGLRGLF